MRGGSMCLILGGLMRFDVLELPQSYLTQLYTPLSTHLTLSNILRLVVLEPPQTLISLIACVVR